MDTRIKKIILALLAIIVVAGVAVIIYKKAPNMGQISSEEKIVPNPTGDMSCVKEKDPVEVKGSSLSGILESGESAWAFKGYFGCNEIRINDLVLYNWTGEVLPLVKIAKGVPGDSISLKPAGASWNILINGKAIKNSKGDLYAVNDQAARMLNLYIKDYKGIIPKDAYLLLGNVAVGTEDSTRFGLASKDDIVGLVLK